MVVPYLQIVLILLTVSSFIIGYTNYKKYYEYLKFNYNVEFVKLIKKDRVIDAVGEWIRWPIGSAWLLLSIFNIKEDYGDNNITNYKKKSLIYFVMTIGLFLLSLLLSSLLV